MRAVLVAGVVKVTAAGGGRLCWLRKFLMLLLQVVGGCVGCGSCKGYCCRWWEVVLVVGGPQGCTSRAQLLVGVVRVALDV